MDILFGAATTHIRRKTNELVTGYNSNVTDIASINAGIASINAGNIGETVAAAGSAQTDATVLSVSKFIHRITGANGSLGVKLPAGTIGQVHIVLNTVNAILKVYPATGEEVENGGANVAFSGVALYGYIFTYLDVANGWDAAAFLLVAN